MNKLIVALLSVLFAMGIPAQNHNKVRRGPPPPPPVTSTPTFEDDFNTGRLSSTWIVSNWAAPGSMARVNNGSFSPSMVDMSQGCLRIKLTQARNSDGSVTSVGGEIQLNKLFGYGTYVFKMRTSSTSPTYNGSGTAVSGQVSAAFNYLPDANYNSVTEIDAPEIEGQNPNQLSFTVWNNSNQSDHAAVPFYGSEDAFHEYKFQWFAGSVKFFVDGALVYTATQNIPTLAAYPMINHWGTNSTDWGGFATPDVDRYMYVSSFKFYAGIAV
jgi:endo-1,3-1,4-beta-glycanase ExoK